MLNGAPAMNTLYDWLSIAVFAGLAVLFLHRSVSQDEQKDRMILYAPPAIGCAAANYVGNQGIGWLSVVILLAVVGYILHILKPFPGKS